MRGNIATTIKQKRTYSQEVTKLSLTKRHADLAVVIHLYYRDNWNYFVNRLKNLQKTPFDLFLTIPKENVSFIEEVKKTYPDVRYIVCPNRGRDVLPFLHVLQHLVSQKYKYLLKFHSKKSTHWDGGDAWLKETMNSLLPDSQKRINQVIACLQRQDTGIIGPQAFYYPLTINFPANGLHMKQILTELYDSEVANDTLQTHRKDFGFFGGTMFWARIDAIYTLANKIVIRRFEPENGQIDGTYAHALERVFCLVPEIDGREMYQLSISHLSKRPYLSENIPDWSTDHDK